MRKIAMRSCSRSTADFPVVPVAEAVPSHCFGNSLGAPGIAEASTLTSTSTSWGPCGGTGGFDGPDDGGVGGFGGLGGDGGDGGVTCKFFKACSTASIAPCVPLAAAS